jgi:hypothetical protein
MIAGATSFTDLICGAPIERYDGQPVDNFNARRIASSPSTWQLLVSAAALEGMPTPSAFAYLRFAFRSRAWRMRPALRRRQCRLMMRGGTTVEGRCAASFGRSLVGIALATIGGPMEAVGRRSAFVSVPCKAVEPTFARLPLGRARFCALARSKWPKANRKEATAARKMRNEKPSQIVLVNLSPHSSYPPRAEIHQNHGFRDGLGRPILT